MTPSNSDFIHRFIPHSGNTSVSLLLLHGTGGNEEDLIPLGQKLLPGAALLSPRGRVLENGAPRFFRRLREGVFDQQDLKRQTDDLALFVADAALRYGLQDGKIIAVGYSNGANIASSLLLTHPHSLSGAVLFRPMVPFHPSVSPDLTDFPVLLGAGRHDPIVPPAQTSALAEILEAAGARVAIHWHPGGHALGQDDIATAQEWLAPWGPP